MTVQQVGIVQWSAVADAGIQDRLPPFSERARRFESMKKQCPWQGKRTAAAFGLG